MTESRFQREVIKKLEERFPNCVILRNDPRARQGMLDVIVLWENCWASLEFKKSADAEVQPNQEYYVRRLGEMSFAAFIYPENEEEVLNALQQAFESSRRTRIS